MPKGVYQHRPLKSFAERFWEKVNIRGPSECWEWMASRRSGYGQLLGAAGRLVQAHRVAYEFLLGPIPDGLQIDHLCRNRACVNPAHLEPVSQRENLLRGSGRSAVNAVKTHCPAGHPYDEGNTHRDAKGRRFCRACGRRRAREYQARRKARATP